MRHWAWWLFASGCAGAGPEQRPTGTQDSLHVSATCGNGQLEAGEECDDGTDNADAAGCTTACSLAVCGDGLVWSGVEECDDANLGGGDGCRQDCRLPLLLELANADATYVGEAAGDYAGASVSGAGDVNGDGFGDLLVGADLNDAGGSVAGAAYLVLGPTSGTNSLATADARMIGEAAGDYAGASVSGAGDVDGDGFGDLLVGAEFNDAGGSAAGAAYLVLGPTSGTNLLATADAKFVGEAADDRAGCSVSGAGDVDGDGFDDLLIGAAHSDSGGLEAGTAYLMLGPTSGTVSLATADATFVGEADGDFAGRSVSGAGDVDGDGFDDVLVGAGGVAYLVLGPTLGITSLANADATLLGEAEGDGAGLSVSGGGDVNGDGVGDMLVGAYLDDAGGSWAGAAYLVLGPASGTVSLATADTKFVGESEGDFAGYSVSGAGDVNGDGFDDVLVGAVNNNTGGSRAGAAYLVLGPSLGTLSIANADAKFVGEAEDDGAGYSVSGVGDVDGDGFEDVLFGAHKNRSFSGAAYLILGSRL